MGSDDRNKVGNSLKMMLVAMCSFLGMAILIIIILQIYSRYLLRRRRAILFRTIGVAAAEVNSSQPPKSGFDQSVIEWLPIFNYKSNDAFDQGEAIKCSVCLSTIVEEALVMLLPNSKHLFHADCIGMWLTSHMTCPNCRTLAAPRLQSKHCGLEVGVQPVAPPVEERSLDGAAELEKVGGSGTNKVLLEGCSVERDHQGGLRFVEKKLVQKI